MTLDEVDFHSLREDVARDRMNLIADIVKISQTPAPTSDERDRAEVLASRFRELYVDNVYIDPEGNVVAHRKTRDVPPVCVTAHLDTVFDRSVNHTVEVNDRVISGPSVGDDSLGLATLLSIIRLLPPEEPGNLILLGTTGTEGQGNLRGSRYFVDNFEDDLGAVLCLEGHGLGRIDYWSLGNIRLRVKASSKGGHVWRDETGPNPIKVLSGLITKLYQKTDTAVEADNFGVINAGRIEGGSSFNTVPYSCELDLEIRSDDNDLMEKLYNQTMEVIGETQKSSGLKLSVEEVTRRPVTGLGLDHWLVDEVEEIHDELGITSEPGPASSDGCIFINAGIPTVTLGLARGHHRHHEDETIELDSLETGQVQLMMALTRCAQRLSLKTE